MTVEDIYKRLAAGESDKAIAEELINMLNQALDMRDKDKAKENQKKEAATHAAEVLNEYFSTYTNWTVKLTGEDIEAIGSVVDNTKIEITDEPHRKGIKIKTSSGGAGFNPDEIIGDFLDAFKLR